VNNRLTFGVTYAITTPESAEEGDFAERGWAAEWVRLREAIKELHRTRTVEVDGVTDIDTTTTHRAPDWLARPVSVNVCNGPEFRTGATEERTLHIPNNVTNASARRIARLAMGPNRYRY
jgi:hypothetical protein